MFMSIVNPLSRNGTESNKYNMTWINDSQAVTPAKNKATALLFMAQILVIHKFLHRILHRQLLCFSD